MNVASYKKRFYMGIALVLCFCMVSAQDLAFDQGLANKQALSQQSEKQSLVKVLNDVKAKYKVSFLYQKKNVTGKTIEGELNFELPLTELLNLILTPNNLYFEKTSQTTYVIYPADAKNNNRKTKYSEDVLMNGSNSQQIITTAGIFAVQTTKAFVTVSGRVLDEIGNPIAGVSVVEKETQNGTSTDQAGNFSLNIRSLNATLIFSSIGYEIQEVPLNGNNSLNVKLTRLAISAEEIVVIGYGTQKRAAVSGAISSVTSKSLKELPVASVDQALQGRVPGLTVTNNGGPGQAPIISIRGISSVGFASTPLYVVDGFPTGNLSNFDSRDIESVEVLKDASAAAIYGSRATNGVLIITTKKGRRDGKMRVDLDTYIGTQKEWNRIDLLNTEQYLQYERALNGAAGIGKPPRLETGFNEPIYDGTSQTYAQTNTDWQDAYFKSGVLTQTNIGVSGGNDVSRYYTSAGYFKQDGISEGLNYDRWNFRINSDHRISKTFNIGENLFVSYSTQRYDNTSGNRTRLVNVIRSLPYLPVYDPTTLGGYRGAENSVDGSDPTNPVEDAVLLGNAKQKTFKILGTVYAEVNFTPWLKFRSTFGVDHANAFQHQFSPIFNDKGRSATLAKVTDSRNIFTSLLYTEQLTFDKNFDNHHINATAIFERQEGNNRIENMTGNQSTNDVETIATATNVTAQSTLQEYVLISYIGRVNYDYAGKYFLSGALRRDGLSIWAPGKKFANFPSASAAWRISEESFMKGLSAVTDLKLRVGWGKTGIDGINVGYYPWQVVVNANQATYPFNNTYSTGNASYYNALGNAEMEWETTDQINVGIDIGLFNNKFTLSAEYFKRQTDNLLLNVPTPTSFGFDGGGVLANVGSMRNHGFELIAGYHQRKGAFQWNVDGNISIIRNEVLALNTPNAAIEAGGDQDFGGGSNMTRTVAGEPIQSFYGWVVDGIFQTQAEVDASPTQVDGKTAPGDLKFRDVSGPEGKPDGVITADDRVFLGSYLPKFTYALILSGTFKNFDASIFFQGTQGNKIFNASRIISEGMARLFGSGTEVLNAWTPNNTGSGIPRAISGDPNQNVRPSNRWIEDGSFLRLKNLMIGYTIPEERLQSFAKGSIRSVRFYVSSQNLFTITNYKGWDPEIGSKNTTLTNGIDYGQYPAARSFQFGLQVSF